MSRSKTPVVWVHAIGKKPDGDWAKVVRVCDLPGRDPMFLRDQSMLTPAKRQLYKDFRPVSRDTEDADGDIFTGWILMKLPFCRANGTRLSSSGEGGYSPSAEEEVVYILTVRVD